MLRLPRRRGDRPGSVPDYRTLDVAPPQARGSTQRVAQAEATLKGSPAGAGIDPA